MTEAPVNSVKTAAQYILPPSLVSKIDLSRLVTEVERVDNELTAAEVRAKGNGGKAAQPVLSQQLVDFLQANDTSLSDGQTRMELIKQLRQLKDKAPVIHMTFAVTADVASLQYIAQWLRQEIDPQAVVAVGLQPGLVAGVYVRTPNHVHDFSLRGHLAAQREVLAKELGALRGNR